MADYQPLKCKKKCNGNIPKLLKFYTIKKSGLGNRMVMSEILLEVHK